MTTEPEQNAAPQVRVVSPAELSGEEAAALVAVLSSLGGAAPAAPEPRSNWAGRARQGWRASGLPNGR